jgi:molybdenum cofactor cytidylyltransferase
MRPGTAAVILAAGLGTRFGGGKMLATIDGQPMLQHVLDLARSAKLEPIVLVAGTGTQADEEPGVTTVVNDAPERGLSTSISIGFAALATTRADRALVLLGDQPRLTLAQLEPLLTSPPDPARPIVVPRYSGVPGNPVLLERAAWPLVADLEGDRGMSQLFADRANLVRYVDVPGTNPDVDTPADLAALTRDAGSGRSDRTEAAGRNRP